MTLSLIVSAIVSLTAVSDGYPALSPDGQTLAFVSSRSGRDAMWLANSDGSNPRVLLDNGANPGAPVWSPDGKWIAFAMRPPDAKLEVETEIYVMPSTGGEPRRLTYAPGDDSHPHWSPDGTRIIFNSTRTSPDLTVPWNRQKFSIHTISPDGSKSVMLFACETLCSYPSFSPDGNRIALRIAPDEPGKTWEQEPSKRNSEVFVTDLSGGHRINLSRDPGFDGWPTWSPDGDWVYFASNRDGKRSEGQIFRSRPDGGEIQRITPSDGWSRVQPSVSSSGVVYFSERREDLGSEIGHLARTLPDPN